VAATKCEGFGWPRAISAQLFSRQLDQKHGRTSTVFSIFGENFSAKRGEVTDKEWITAISMIIDVMYQQSARRDRKQR
jgi:hypothetical protein